MASAEQLKERKQFDQFMNQKFHSKKFLSERDIDQIRQIEFYNPKRLAYWIKKQAKKLVMECITFFQEADILNNKNQKICLSAKQHFC